MFGKDKKRFIVCGLGTVGSKVADTLDKLHFYVMGVDIDEKVVSSIREDDRYNFECFHADAHSRSFMADLAEMPKFDVGIVTMESFTTRLICIKMLQQLGVEHIVARAVDDLEEAILADMKVERFEHIKEDLGKHMAHLAISKNILDYCNLSIYNPELYTEEKNFNASKETQRYSVMSIVVPRKFEGSNITDFKKTFAIIKTIHILGVYHHDQPAGENNPSFCRDEQFDKTQVSKGDTLIICGPDKHLETLIEEIAKISLV